MNLKAVLGIIFFILAFNTVNAQQSKEEHPDFSSIMPFYDSLKIYNKQLMNGKTEAERSQASYNIIKAFSRSLRMENSFQFPFDSLNAISILTPDNHKFRIFTWQLAHDNKTYRYFGVIQLNEEKPKIIPLVDYAPFYDQVEDVIVDGDRWIGALYYKIIPFAFGKDIFYALLGWDGNNAMTNKKYIDILWFDKDGKAKFGYPIFDNIGDKNRCRILLEYKKDAVLSLTYDSEKKTIYYDHLVSLSGNNDLGAFDKVPDGTLEAFVLSKNGRWKHIDLVDYVKLKDGQAPNVSKVRMKQLYQPLPPR